MEGNKREGSIVFKGLEPSGCAASWDSQAADALLMWPFKDSMLEACGGSRIGRLVQEAELKGEPRAPSAFALHAAKQKPSFSATAASLAHFAFKAT